jgi:Tol biopolymer transport system component
LTSGEFVRNPIWSRDGARIVFVVATKGADDFRGRLDWRPADGSREAGTLVPEGPFSSPSAFTPDGRTLLFDRTENGAAGDIWALPLDGDRQSRALVSDPFLKYGATVSPDGRWLAYVSNESGQGSVYVRPFPKGEGRWQISVPRGEEPNWGPDGRELFYRADSVLYRVAIDSTHGFIAGRPEPFLDRVASGSQVHSYALSPDGSRILTARAAKGSGAQRILYLDLGFARRLNEPGSGMR